MWRVLLLTVLLFLSAALARAEDIPLESCDRLPVVQVTVSGANFLFLVDTAATSMLNLKSFAEGDSRKIAVTSWSGTVETHAREITLRDFAIGRHHINSLNLPAIDLSSIGSACGRRIDGILGVDLLSELGATVDLKNRTAHLDSESTDTNARVAELQARLAACEQAFNDVNEPVFADCLDPQIVLFAAGGDFYGREAAMDYYRQRYFRHQPRAHLVIDPRGAHVIGDAIWVEYDLRIDMGEQVIRARGTALCEKSGGKWRIVHMNHSAPPPDSFQAKTSQ
ncbi:MAG TPA: nuclear transport factor 2 family protein [Terriglobales bacterium]|nr:nuclear transport factor 2 family protein [Terriglobales bacterium]